MEMNATNTAVATHLTRNMPLLTELCLSTLGRESGDVLWCGTDVPRREAFGVRGACSRFRITPAL
jgi:hypothetical protein